MATKVEIKSPGAAGPLPGQTARLPKNNLRLRRGGEIYYDGPNPHVAPVGGITKRDQKYPIGPPITNQGLNNYKKNDTGNIVRISQGDNPYPSSPNSGTKFQGGRRAFGNAVVNYSPSATAPATVGSLKIAGTSSTTLGLPTMPGQDSVGIARKRQQPITATDVSWRGQHGGQKHLPSYKRNKMGRQG